MIQIGLGRITIVISYNARIKCYVLPTNNPLIEILSRGRRLTFTKRSWNQSFVWQFVSVKAVVFTEL